MVHLIELMLWGHRLCLSPFLLTAILLDSVPYVPILLLLLVLLVVLCVVLVVVLLVAQHPPRRVNIN